VLFGVVAEVGDEPQSFIRLRKVREWTSNPLIVQATIWGFRARRRHDLGHDGGFGLTRRKVWKALLFDRKPIGRLSEGRLASVNCMAFDYVDDGDIYGALADAIRECAEASAEKARILIQEESKFLRTLKMMTEQPIMAVHER